MEEFALDGGQENNERNALIERLAEIDKINKEDLAAKLDSNLSCSQVYDHLKLLQQNMDKYDEIGAKIRDWTIGLWTGTLVAGFLSKDACGEKLWVLIWISIAIAIVMGIYDEIFKSFREKYKDSRKTLLEKFQHGSCKKCDIQFPEQDSGWTLILGAFKKFCHPRNPHVNFVYWLLIAVSFLIAIMVARNPASIVCASGNLT
jgi:hypothetical protein